MDNRMSIELPRRENGAMPDLLYGDEFSACLWCLLLSPRLLSDFSLSSHVYFKKQLRPRRCVICDNWWRSGSGVGSSRIKANLSPIGIFVVGTDIGVSRGAVKE